MLDRRQCLGAGSLSNQSYTSVFGRIPKIVSTEAPNANQTGIVPEGSGIEIGLGVGVGEGSDPGIGSESTGGVGGC